MKNILERAAQYKDQRRAIRLVADALKIEDPVAYKFCSPEHWRVREPWSRLNEIEAWLVCECRAAMRLVPVADPMKTVGTND